MSQEYDPTKLSDGGKDWVRAEIGDTETDGMVLLDEEITNVISEESNKWFAAARCCGLIMAKDMDAVLKKVGDLQIDTAGDNAESAYRKHQAYLRERGASELLTDKKIFRMM